MPLKEAVGPHTVHLPLCSLAYDVDISAGPQGPARVCFLTRTQNETGEGGNQSWPSIAKLQADISLLLTRLEV